MILKELPVKTERKKERETSSRTCQQHAQCTSQYDHGPHHTVQHTAYSHTHTGRALVAPLSLRPLPIKKTVFVQLAPKDREAFDLRMKAASYAVVYLGHIQGVYRVLWGG